MRTIPDCYADIRLSNSYQVEDLIRLELNGRVATPVYRKPIFTGFGSEFLSIIAAFINRAYSVFSIYVSFRKIEFLLYY